MIIKSLVVGPISTNCYVIGDPETKVGAVIDPGGHHKKVMRAIEDTELNIKYILATHGHFDHVYGLRELVEELGVDFLIHEDGEPFVADSVGRARNWGFTMDPSPLPTGYLREEEPLILGKLEIKVLHTPGHSPGGVSLYIESEGVVFVGDTLFARSIGRTDFTGGSFEVLSESIRNKLYTLPDDTIVYTGHGPKTRIADEKRGNPFVRFDR